MRYLKYAIGGLAVLLFALSILSLSTLRQYKSLITYESYDSNGMAGLQLRADYQKFVAESLRYDVDPSEKQAIALALSFDILYDKVSTFAERPGYAKLLNEEALKLRSEIQQSLDEFLPVMDAIYEGTFDGLIGVADKLSSLQPKVDRLSILPIISHEKIADDQREDLRVTAYWLSFTFAGFMLCGLLFLLINWKKERELRNQKDLLEKSESRYRALFEYSPVAMEVSDWSAIREFIGKSLTGANAGRLGDTLWRLTKRVELSARARGLLSESGSLCLGGLSGNEEPSLEYKKGIEDASIAFMEGRDQHTFQVEEQTDIDKKCIYFVRISRPDKADKTWQRIIISIDDISKEREAELTLRKAQKMEAIGQLTGGLAHDFNNLLLTVSANAELILDTRNSHEDFASEIIKAVERGADITRRLLAFSRKQVLQPKTVSLKPLTRDMARLLKRTLPESISIENVLPSDLWDIKVDPGQLENAILNLAINARDAMPNGGSLHLDYSNVELNEANERLELEAGAYVKLSVRDSGVGMSKEVLEHVIEPFYTTKKVGHGSGLGLSMVHGFMRQSGGALEIQSVLEKGTTISLYLPRASGTVDKVHESMDEVTHRGNGEQILLIEDDAHLRTIVELMLKRLDYNVITAIDAVEADTLLARRSEVSLVLSDVILTGGTNGPTFAKQIKPSHPNLKFVFMSGYFEDEGKYNGGEVTEYPYIAKPFNIRSLSAILAQSLGKTI